MKNKLKQLLSVLRELWKTWKHPVTVEITLSTRLLRSNFDLYALRKKAAEDEKIRKYEKWKRFWVY